MAYPKILHMFAPGDNISPFDVNMATDAGYEVLAPYTGVTLEGIGALAQDAAFSRPLKRTGSTGLFIGGRDVSLADDMLRSVKEAMFSPFECSAMADPNGAFTTSSALVALVEKWVKTKTSMGLKGLEVLVFGTGPVGLCIAVLAARQGARAKLVSLTRMPDKQTIDSFARRFSVDVAADAGKTPDDRSALLETAHVAVSAAKAGVCVIDRERLRAAGRLMVAADVNAVPPAGIEGVHADCDGTEIQTEAGTVLAIGALVAGKIKYDVQHGLFNRMLTSNVAEYLGLIDAHDLAISQV